MARRGNFGSRRRGRRAPLRKFVWARTTGVLVGPSETGADLLDVFQTEYGAQLVGATVMRIRGYIRPNVVATSVVTGHCGIIVESDNELNDQNALQQGPSARPHDDWLAWLPWLVDNSTGVPALSRVAETSWNFNASPWAVDIKSSRKIEELGQGLHLWYDFVAGGGEPTPPVDYDLSIGLKLP